MPTDIAIIGPGNWGTSLAAALRRARLPVSEVVSRDGFKQAALEACILWLCVPDRSIETVVKQIVRKRKNLAGQLVIHSSGVLSVNALNAAHKAGAEVAAVHPVMSFPTRRVVSLRGVLFGVEADPAIRRRLSPILRKIGGRPFAIQSEKKALYHAAGTLASPLLVSELSAAIEAVQFAGLSQKQATEYVRLLAQATVRNVFSRGLEQSFSGPFARGDAATISLHLQALAQHPILAAVYRTLAENAIQSLPVKRRKALEVSLRET